MENPIQNRDLQTEGTGAVTHDNKPHFYAKLL